MMKMNSNKIFKSSNAKLVVLDYKRNEVKVFEKCPSEWSGEEIEDFLYMENSLDLTPGYCEYMYGKELEVKTQDFQTAMMEINKNSEGKEVNLPSTDNKKIKRVDFAAKRSQLMKDTINEIKNIFKDNGIEELDLILDDEGNERYTDGYIIRNNYGCGSPQEVKVTYLKFENDKLWYVGESEDYTDEDWQDLYDDVVSDNLDLLYDAVCDRIDERNNG